jgi:hypothetical protein
VIAGLSAILVLALIGPAASAARTPPPGLAKFKYAVGKVESGGNYYARNPYSGAYGKYQIMPSNWPAWAQRYLGNRYARQTPANQEKVASGKFTSLHRSLGSWRRVAYWWLTGSKRTSGWSASATRYVKRVMRLYAKAGGQHGTDPAPVKRGHISEKSSAVTYTGSWRSAAHSRYAGDHVLYTKTPGASATVAFTGRKVTWYGPGGPTRGRAKVYVDGVYRKTVDLHRSTFKARVAAFTTSWAQPGAHTVRIEVVGTGSHPMIAIDEFVVTK